MEICMHTIAVEPARWKPARVSRPLSELLPEIARVGFRKLEVFEPHLQKSENEAALVRQMAVLRLEPVILSSYIVTGPEASGAEFAEKAAELKERVARFGFAKVRLFPGMRVAPTDEPSVALVQQRIAELASAMPETEFLIETHDRSIADDPARLVRLLEDLQLPNVGLLYQPVVFQREEALRQAELQKGWIRHFHFQNRVENLAMTTLRDGFVPWQEVLHTVHAAQPERPLGGTIEFVPAGMGPVESFDLQSTLEAIRAEMAYLQSIAPC